ncbi:MAG: hypothetical protein A2946_04240 [Candidatus Liptonbacteria bacterium RIFCSPLOWO2_01_FULL_53_13]|uniref:Methionine--tRNA ligase n=1 Tax=Candidatus Liptonbacteria bacterium RIFCSPLOWO2_01_FULL_53_13 TaxID=1798651 RepID=A0A1G2CKL6_9BACT|nr:MAG: hypothetical protein A2946_04240 [Candidatus Liptonbacteria bacterium RIFCSPLOWO2_01_FULL_53_13]
MTIDEFKKVELRVAKVISAERVEGSEKLVKLQIDCGDKDAAILPAGRQVVAGIGKAYSPEELVGKKIIIVANLEPRVFKIAPELELTSNGMLLAATEEGGAPVLLTVEKEVAPGSSIS